VRSAFSFLFALWWSGMSPPFPALAAIEPARDADGYLVYAFDFESEREDRDLDKRLDADRWERQRGPGYPFYAPCVLDPRRPHNGRSALRLEPNGASVAVATVPLPASRFQSYEVTAWVRTQGLKRATPHVRLLWLAEDRATHLGASATVVREPVTPPPSAATSHPRADAPPSRESPWFRVRLSADPPQDRQFAFLRLNLSVDAGPEGSDYDAAVWFDEVVLREVPRAALTTNEPANLLPADGPKVVTLLLSGLKTEAAPATFAVFEASRRTGLAEGPENGVRPQRKDIKGAAPTLPPPGREVYRVETTLRPTQEPTLVARFQPNVTQPGLYRADLRLGNASAPLLTRSLWFALAAELPTSTRDPDLGVDLAPCSSASIAQPSVSRLVGRLNCRLTRLPLSLLEDGAALDRRLGDLADAHIRVAAALSAPPNAPGGTAALLQDPPETWRDALTALAGRCGPCVQAWQLGDDAEQIRRLGAAVWDVGAAVRSLREPPTDAAAAHPGRAIGIPWNALYALPPPAPGDRVGRPLDFVSLDLGTEVPPQTIPEIVRRCRNAFPSPQTAVWTNLRLLDRTQFGREARAADLVQRLVAAKQTGAQRIVIGPLADDRVGLLRADGSPTEETLVWRTLCAHLDGLPYAGEAPLGDGVRGVLFGDAAGAVLVLWADDGPRRAKVLVQPGAQLVSLVGERTDLDAAPGGAELVVGPVPVLVTGVDFAAAGTVASFSLDQPHLECEYRVHSRTVRLTNAFPGALSGRLVFLPPPGWRVEPRQVSLSLAPGARLGQSVTVHLPLSAVAGPTELRARLELKSGAAPAIEALAAAPLHLGLIDLDVRTAVRPLGVRPSNGAASNLKPQPLDPHSATALELTVALRHTGKDRGDFSCTISAPGWRTPTDAVFAVPPGGEAEKRFVLERAADVARPGTMIRIALRQINGPRFLNVEVPIAPPKTEWTTLEPAASP
jgi:hypothetical protein